MKTLHKLYIVISVLLLAILAISCNPKTESMGSAGQTIVKLFPDTYNMLAFDALTTPQSGILFEVRRDLPNSTDLNSTTTVVLKYDADTAIIKKYNSVHGLTVDDGTAFIPLPPELGTITPAISAGTVTVNFAAGEFGEPVNISIPSAASFDFSKHYALAFVVQSVSGTGKLTAAANDTIFCEILAKNRFDGVYTVTGSFVDYLSPAFVGPYPSTIQLRTTGSLSCSRFDADFGDYFYFFFTDATLSSASYFGNWAPAFIFDANNNVIDCINTIADPLPRQRTAVLYTGPGSINKWNASDKSMDVTFQLKALTTNPQIRNLITEHYVYKGPR